MLNDFTHSGAFSSPVEMNETSGKSLYELCRPYMNVFESGMDFFDFVEEIGMFPEQLNKYFSGEQNLPGEDLAKFARVCRMEKDNLRESLNSAFNEQLEKLRKEQALKEEIEKSKEEHALQKERWAFLEARKAEILAELKEYGIANILDTADYPFEDYYPLMFIMGYLKQKECLPKLEALLKTCSDEDLVYKNSNALMWAADSELSYEELLLLEDRKDFISQYIGQKDRIGRTALHRYANSRFANPDGIDLLVEWGADVNAKDDYLWTPLHDAASRQSPLFGRLCQHGAISSQNDEGRTPDAIWDWIDALDAW